MQRARQERAGGGEFCAGQADALLHWPDRTAHSLRVPSRKTRQAGGAQLSKRGSSSRSSRIAADTVWQKQAQTGSVFKRESAHNFGHSRPPPVCIAIANCRHRRGGQAGGGAASRELALAHRTVAGASVRADDEFSGGLNIQWLTKQAHRK